MYTVYGIDIFDGKETKKQDNRDLQFRSIDEINAYEKVMQKRIQEAYDNPIEVFAHYKIPIKEHTKHKDTDIKEHIKAKKK
jgi:hypothetical protein